MNTAALVDPDGLFVPSPEHVSAVHDAGKRFLASGPIVMEELDAGVQAGRAGADLIMANHPVALQEAITATNER